MTPFTSPTSDAARQAFAAKPRALVDKVMSVADADAHYNLACRYASLKQPDLALRTLRTAVELGYRDFRAMVQDRQLDSVRKDPRFRALLREYQS